MTEKREPFHCNQCQRVITPTSVKIKVCPECGATIYHTPKPNKRIAENLFNRSYACPKCNRLYENATECPVCKDLTLHDANPEHLAEFACSVWNSAYHYVLQNHGLREDGSHVADEPDLTKEYDEDGNLAVIRHHSLDSKGNIVVPAHFMWYWRKKMRGWSGMPENEPTEEELNDDYNPVEKGFSKEFFRTLVKELLEETHHGYSK